MTKNKISSSVVDGPLQRALSGAVDSGSLDRAKAALNQGADPNHRIYGQVEVPLLMRAIADRHLPLALALLEAGADANVTGLEGRSTMEARSALELACEIAGPAGAEFVAALCAHSVKSPTHEAQLDAAARFALERGRKEALRALVHAGLDIRAEYRGRRSLLDHARNGNYESMAGVMLGAEAEMEGAEIKAALSEPKGPESGKKGGPRV